MEIKGNKVVLGFDKEKFFFKELVSEKTSSLLKNLYREKYNKNIEVSVIGLDKKEGTILTMKDEKERKKKEEFEGLKKNVENDKNLKLLLDTFNGTVEFVEKLK